MTFGLPKLAAAEVCWHRGVLNTTNIYMYVDLNKYF